jgi:thioredoxin reductase
MSMHDAIIVGGGPAGVSAALVLGRACRKVVLVDAGRPRNFAARAMHNYPSRDGISPQRFRKTAFDELKSCGVERIAGEATTATCVEDGFVVRLRGRRRLNGRTLLLATGVVDRLPDLPGFAEHYGVSVHHCPYCDAYPWRDRKLAAYGAGRKAAGLAIALRQWSASVVAIVADGAMLGASAREKLEANGIAIIRSDIARLEGVKGRLRRIVLANGEVRRCDAMFFNTEQAQRSPLPVALGCEMTRKGGVRVDRRGRTNVQGLYVAGDALRDVQFVVTAAADGAAAALAMDDELRKRDGRLL